MQQNQNVNRIVVTGEPAKEKLLSGVNQVCDVIGSTMGYRGSNCLFETFSGLPHITSDGYDSLEMMFLSDPIENMACELVKEACRKQHDVVGDNTTLVCVLTQTFFQNSLKAVENGKNAIEVSSEILKSVDKIIAYLDELAIPLTDELMYSIAKTSAHGDDAIAKLVQEAFIKAGEYGSVSHGRSFTDETYIDFIDGNPIERGYAHEGYINIKETQQVVFNNPKVIVSGKHIENIQDLIPFFSTIEDWGNDEIHPTLKTSLVIISTMEDNVSESILANVRAGFPICVITPPYIGKKGRENISDLALIFGCEVLDGISRSDFEGKTIPYMGTCSKIVIGEKDSVVTLNPDRDKSNEQGVINELTAQILIQTNDNEKNYLKERIAKISGGIATILVGGVTPSEVEEKVARVDDSVCAVRSAKDGVVAGGGVALESSIYELDLDNVTYEAIQAPYKKILSNANMKPKERIKWEGLDKWFYFFKNIFKNGFKYEIIDNSMSYPYGYDVKEFKEVNMFDAGIIDTVKGVKNALVNAVSASNNLLRTNYIMPFKRTANGK